MVLDASNNVVVTGSALTVKYDSNGNQLWTAPYAGTALAVDNNCNAYVAGFSRDFGTVKLTPQGSNVWLKTYVESYGPTISQSVLVDSGNNVYVSGLDSYYSFTQHGIRYGPYVLLTTIKYGSNGNQIWLAQNGTGAPQDFNVQVAGAALDAANNLYLISNWPDDAGYTTFKYSTNGQLSWKLFPTFVGSALYPGNAYGVALDKMGNVLLTGQVLYLLPGGTTYIEACGTYKANTNGLLLWPSYSPMVQVQPSAGLAIAVDLANNSYVTGYSPGTNSGNDIVTIKYDQNGNQIWVQRYNGPGNGDDEGNAIAVDNNGNVYVTGYETTAAGGTEMVTIKYAPPTPLQRRADGTMLLQAQGSPGENFDIQASADLQLWLDLGIVTADTNGLMQYDDTNASNFTSRFYLASPH